MIDKLKRQIQKSPQNPGVYIFKNKKGDFLYIGKAANLKNRLKQYLNKKTYSPFLESILNQSKKIETQITNSEVEALILESKLIKEYQPKFNIRLRDDKQYFYVGFTHSTSSGQAEEFPRIFLTHQPFDSLRSLRARPKTDFIGPFTDGAALKTALRLLRRIFPYCTCKQKHNNFCLNYHIGKCLGFCCLKINQKLNIKNKNDILKIKNIYKENVRAIKDILSGRRKYLFENLRKRLNQLAKKQEFEKAIELKNKIEKLERVFESAKIINREVNNKNVLIELKKLFKLSGTPKRIEGYDISNIQGQNAVGAMVVLTNGQLDKKEYRKFKIKINSEPLYLFHDREINTTPKDDIAMLKEVLSRRLNHPEWPYPDLIFVDGGRAQLNAAKETVLKQKNISYIFNITNLPIISLAKGRNEIFSSTLKKPIPIKSLPTPVQNLIRQIDSEAHRFAISYYRKIHRKRLIA